jgi:hypothetical protein
MITINQGGYEKINDHVDGLEWAMIYGGGGITFVYYIVPFEMVHDKMIELFELVILILRLSL